MTSAQDASEHIPNASLWNIPIELTSGLGKPPWTWHSNLWFEFLRRLDGPVTSARLGGPEKGDIFWRIALGGLYYVKYELCKSLKRTSETVDRIMVTNLIFGQTKSVIEILIWKTHCFYFWCKTHYFKPWCKNSLWTKTVVVSVADPALLIAVQETWEINIRGIFLEHSYCNHKHKQYPFHLYCNFKIFHHYRRHRLHLKDTSSSSSPSGMVTIREFLKFIGSDVSPAKEIC